MNKSKQLSQKNLKGIGGLLIVIAIIMVITSLLSRNIGAALGIFLAFWMGALVVSLGYRAK